MIETLLEIIIGILITPNHYFAEVFLLNILGIALEVEEFILNLM